MLILRQFLDLSLEENFFTGIDKVLVVGMVSKYTYFHHVLGTISIFYNYYNRVSFEVLRSTIFEP